MFVSRAQDLQIIRYRRTLAGKWDCMYCDVTGYR